MAILKVYKNQNLLQELSSETQISNELEKVGIDYQYWPLKEELDGNSSLVDIENLFKEKIQKVLKDNNFSSYDIVNIKPELEGLDKLKSKFIPEHIHEDNEVRFFIDGQGLFCMNINDQIYQLLCQKGDYVSVPAHTKHWFDMGSEANFKCLRFFENPEGWIAKYTGSNISLDYPLLDEFYEKC